MSNISVNKCVLPGRQLAATGDNCLLFSIVRRAHTQGHNNSSNSNNNNDDDDNCRQHEATSAQFLAPRAPPHSAPISPASPLGLAGATSSAGPPLLPPSEPPGRRGARWSGGQSAAICVLAGDWRAAH